MRDAIVPVRGLLLAFVLLAAAGGAVRAGDPPPLIPRPQRVEWRGGRFELRDDIEIQVPVVTGRRVRREADLLLDELLDLGAVNVSWTVRDPQAEERGEIVLRLGAVDAPVDSPEAYQLDVRARRVEITASRGPGLLRAFQTLEQLVVTETGRRWFATCSITDWPEYALRGVMFDTGRNFVSLGTIERFIDLMARYKMNLFHFHLTENIGWRLEILSHPELTAPEAQLREPGRFYTLEQIDHLLAFCRDRGVTVVPEIDMPGHSAAFERATGHAMESPEGVRILEDVLAEVCERFDGPYVHLGSDEVRIANKAFLPAMAKVVRDHDKEVVLWRPGGPLDAQAIYQLWHTGEGAPGERVIDSRDLYVNHLDWFSGPMRVFYKQLCDRPVGSAERLGGILCLWPDRRVSREAEIFRQNPVVPVMLAFAERAWRGGGHSELARVLPPESELAFAEFADFEQRLVTHREIGHLGFPCLYFRQTGIVWKVWGPFPNHGDLETVLPPEEGVSGSFDLAGQVYDSRTARGATLFFGGWYDHGLFGAKKNVTAYAQTWVHVDEERDAHMWIGFRSWSRSHRDDTPALGEWDHRKSRIWLNDELIPPPVWAVPGRKGTLEDPLIDEGYAYRAPTRVHLQAGWNRILLKAPVGEDPTKWMATAIIVGWDGSRVVEAEGVRYAIEPR